MAKIEEVWKRQYFFRYCLFCGFYCNMPECDGKLWTGGGWEFVEVCADDGDTGRKIEYIAEK